MFTFGSDPEFFLIKNKKIYSAIGIVEGNTHSRIRMGGNQFYYDNVAAECAITPGDSKRSVLNNFRNCFQNYSDLVKPYRLVALASFIFKNEQLSNEEARTVGCAKEYCAYEMKQKNSPVSKIKKENLRTCGGHIHVGDECLTGEGPESILFIYMLDLFLGVPSVWLDDNEDSSRRRELYGKAGRYRPTDYGIEYRSLGNFWLKSPDFVDVFYDLTFFALNLVKSGEVYNFWDFNYDQFLNSNNFCKSCKCKKYDVLELRKGINTSNKNILLNHYNMVMSHLPKKIKTSINKLQKSKCSNIIIENW